jgi:hypothetical protein
MSSVGSRCRLKWLFSMLQILSAPNGHYHLQQAATPDQIIQQIRGHEGPKEKYGYFFMHRRRVLCTLQLSIDF